MKTKTILLSTALTLLSYFQVSASGEEGEAEKKVTKSYFSIENQFASKLSSPFFVTQEMTPQTVFIKFHVTNSFKVIIDDMACKDNRLKSHIEKSLASQAIFVDKENVNKSYSMKMTFK
ncbi:hypothetical protein [Owenweeksia hongkongensis]|uniref:hypothetical protein n=1 Tax=Owenweeksia hongkongensis TaxID=253245 RepID=UPI003A8FF3E1